MCAPLMTVEGESNAARLRRQAVAETAFFAEHMPEEFSAGRAACGALVRGLSEMFLMHVRTGWAPKTLRKLESALEPLRAENESLGLPALDGQSPEEVERARKCATRAARRNIAQGYKEEEQACCRQVLEPLKQKLVERMQGNARSLQTEEASDHDLWAEESAEVLKICQRAADKWQSWWVARAQKLVVKQKTGAEERAPFRVERFPRYVRAVLGMADTVVEAEAVRIQADVREAVARFYHDGSPWIKYKTDLMAMPVTITVQKEFEPLVERVVLTFLRGGRAVREGLKAAADSTSGQIEDWAESCREERMRLREKMKKVEEAKAGLLDVLGAASAEELLENAAVRLILTTRIRGALDFPVSCLHYQPLYC